ncbi:MAG: hypothetical protein ABI721_01980 [Candidatus Dojkabacteria bacterium]
MTKQKTTRKKNQEKQALKTALLKNTPKLSKKSQKEVKSAFKKAIVHYGEALRKLGQT